MVLLIVILSILFLAAAFLGYRRIFRLEQLNQRLVINGFVAAMLVLTAMTAANWAGLFTEETASHVTTGIYSLAAGFFWGYGIKLIRMRREAGTIAYMYRSFWADVAPNLIALVLVVYGIYRTGLLNWGPFTGIGITSGLSLIGFGFWGWTLRVVPEFRAKGLLMLDQFLPWSKIVAYEWNGENTLQIDYLTGTKTISEFSTFVPDEDRLIVERLLGKKIKEHEEERKQMMLEDDEN